MFHDLGRENAGAGQSKAILAIEMITYAPLMIEAASRRADFSRIRNVDLGSFIVDRPMLILTASARAWK